MMPRSVWQRSDAWWVAGSVPVLAAVGVAALLFSSLQVAVSYFLMCGYAVFILLFVVRRTDAGTDESSVSAPRLLIQQRMAIERQRYPARLGVFFPVFIVASGVTTASSRGQLDWFVAVAYLLLLGAGWVTGIRLYLRYRQELQAFEAEHGKDAGKQAPVRRPDIADRNVSSERSDDSPP